MSWLQTILSNDSLLLFLLLTFVFKILELIWPAQDVPRRHFFTGFLYGLINTLLLISIAVPVAVATTALVRNFSFGLIDLRDWTSNQVLGSLFAVLLSTFIADFFLYWYHRVRHYSQILWQIHVVHHSDEHMNVTTYAREHVADIILLPFFLTLPMAILFQLPPAAIAIFTLLPRFWEYLSHANIRLGFGPLWWLIASPDYHRIHHSIEKKHFDKNFVIWFPIWDIIFKTAYKPQPGERPLTGVEGIKTESVLQLYAMPFKAWARMLRDR